MIVFGFLIRGGLTLNGGACIKLGTRGGGFTIGRGLGSRIIGSLLWERNYLQDFMVFHMSDVFNSVYQLNVLLILVSWSINEYNSHNLVFYPTIGG